MGNLYSEIGSVTPDNLILDGNVQLKGITLATGQGTLARGTVLGKSPVNNKFYKVDKALEPVVKRTLAITGTETKTATLALAGLTLTGLVVRVNDEYGAIAEAGEAKDYTAAYADGTLTITMIAAGALISASQCYIEINKSSAGANEADCILTDVIDTGTEVDVVAQAYISGQFNRKALVFASNNTSADHEDTLRLKGIFLNDSIAY